MLGPSPLLLACAAVLLTPSLSPAQTPAPRAHDPAVYSSFFRLHNGTLNEVARNAALDPGKLTSATADVARVLHIKVSDYSTLAAITQDVIGRSAALSNERADRLSRLQAANQKPSSFELAQFELRQRQIVMSGVNRMMAELPRLSWLGLSGYINWEHRNGGAIQPIAFQ